MKAVRPAIASNGVPYLQRDRYYPTVLQKERRKKKSQGYARSERCKLYIYIYIYIYIYECVCVCVFSHTMCIKPKHDNFLMRELQRKIVFKNNRRHQFIRLMQ